MYFMIDTEDDLILSYLCTKNCVWFTFAFYLLLL